MSPYDYVNVLAPILWPDLPLPGVRVKAST